MTRSRLVVLLAVAAIALSGCNRFGYDARIDFFDASSGSAYLRASAWLRDVVHEGRPGARPVVRWQVDGEPTRWIPFEVEFGTRPDVDASLGPASAAIDRSIVDMGLARGTYRVCVDVVPAYKQTIGTLTQTQNRPWFAIDGVAVESPAAVSAVDRPDAVAVHGDAVRGIELAATVAPGPHTLCIGVTGPFAGPGVTGTTTCRSFTVS